MNQPASRDQLTIDLMSMRGVWRDDLTAFETDGTPVTMDTYGGVAGAFPYSNLVYVDFDGERYQQTNVTFEGREFHERTFTATVSGGQLQFDQLGPQAPTHIGISGGIGLIWFVAKHMADPGLQRYAEPDLIRISGDRRWRDTVLWRQGALVRTMHVEGARLTVDTTQPHELDPRGPRSSVHGERAVTTNYQESNA